MTPFAIPLRPIHILSRSPRAVSTFFYSIVFLSVNINIQVRNKNEQWVRCALQKGDFLILPAGIYHRFTPAQSDFVQAMRLFKDEPKWTAYPRKDGGDFPERKEYLQQIGVAH